MSVIRGTIKPLRNVVFVTDLESGQRKSAGGIVIPDDNMKEQGIRARWGKVFAVGPDVDDLKVGDWILIKHGRWSFGMEHELPDGTITKIWQADYPNSVEVVTDEFPLDIKPLN